MDVDVGVSVGVVFSLSVFLWYVFLFVCSCACVFCVAVGGLAQAVCGCLYQRIPKALGQNWSKRKERANVELQYPQSVFSTVASTHVCWMSSQVPIPSP